MEVHVRRLKAVRNALTPPPKGSPPHWRRIVVLPDDSHVDVQIPPEGSPPVKPTRIAINGVLVGGYRMLPRTLKLLVSAIGTEFEQSANHVPGYSLLEVLPPKVIDPSGSQSLTNSDVWGLVYALHTLFHVQEHIPIILSSEFANRDEIETYLLESGLARREHVPKGVPSDPELFLLRMTFWQGAGTGGYHNRGWIPGPHRAPFPYVPSFTRNAKVITGHPLRPPKPRPGELLYKKYWPVVGQTLLFHHIDLEEDDAGANGGVGKHLAAFHRWHNHQRVNAGWGEAGSLEKHREYLKNAMENPALLPIMMSWDGELMGYAEVTYIKEDHVAQYIPDSAGGAQDYDRGLHILVGEDRFRGIARSVAWLSALQHYLFLADHRTNRIIAEPKASRDDVVRLACDAGKIVQTVFDFPYKRSALTFSHRDRFFKLDLMSKDPSMDA